MRGEGFNRQKIGYVPQTLHEWLKNAEFDSGKSVSVLHEVTDMPVFQCTTTAAALAQMNDEGWRG